MAFAALGIGVGVCILSYGLARGAAVILSQYGTSTKEMLTHWLYSKFKTTTTATATATATATDTDINDDDVCRNDEGSNAATDINDQQTQEEKAAEELTMIKEEEEEEIIEKEVINNKSPFTAPVSEELSKVTEVVEEKEEPTAEAPTDVVDDDVSVAVEEPNIREESPWTRVKELISKICDRAKRGVWCCYYLKDPDFWDGKKGRILRAVIGVVADCLFEVLTGNKGLRSTVFSKTLLRRLYNILKTNIM